MFTPHKVLPLSSLPDEKTGALRRWVTCPRSHSLCEAALGYETRRPTRPGCSLSGPCAHCAPHFPQGGVWNRQGVQRPSPLQARAVTQRGEGEQTWCWGLLGAASTQLWERQPKVARSLNILRETRNQIFICNLFLFHCWQLTLFPFSFFFFNCVY